jgi:Ring finger domain
MDRPIKFNPTGQYNLNFVDWTNEFERIIEDDELEYYIEIDR